MSYRNRAMMAITALAFTGVLAGCHHSGSHFSTQEQKHTHPAAAASSFAANPAVEKDELTALNKLAGCTSQGTGGTLAFKAIPAAPGSASIPGAPPQPTVQLTHVGLGLFHHPLDKISATVDCAAPPGTRTAVKACVRKLSFPVHKSALSGYLIQVANCMTGAPQ